MANFYAQYASPAQVSIGAQGTNGAPAPTVSLEVAGINPSGNLQPLQTDSSGSLKVSIISAPTTQSVNVSQFGGSIVALGQTTSVGSMPVVIASDQIVPVIRRDIAVSGTISSTESIILSVNGIASAGIQVLGTFSGSISVEGSVDSINYVSTSATNVSTGAVSQSITAAGIYQANISGFQNFRVRGNTVSGGTVTINIRGNAGESAISQGGVWNVGITGGSVGLLPGSSTIGSISNISGTISLPTGASTSALQTTGNTSLSSIDSKLATLGQKTMAGSEPVVIASDQTAIPVSGTISVTGVATAVNQTNASQKTQIVDGAGNVIASTTNALNVAVQGTVPISGTITANQGAANATPWNENITQWGGIATSLGQKVMASSVPVTISSDQSAISTAQKGLLSSNAPVQNLYSTTNITTAAYTQLIASTTSATTFIDIFDSSGQSMILATGAAGLEVIQAYIPPGGDSFYFSIPTGTRVAYKALSANATSGYLLLNLRG